MKRACIFFADGTEECEALIPVDILRRAHVEVVTASVNGTCSICSSHDVHITTDTVAEKIDVASFDLVILPGGMPGTINLMQNKTVAAVCKSAAANGKLVAAICAAPSALASFGLLEGKRATSFPAFRDKLCGAEVVDEPVVEDGNIITGWGMGASIPFSLRLVQQLCGKAMAEQIRAAICYPFEF